MISASRPAAVPALAAGRSASSVTPTARSGAGADMALLICALFLQRFTLSFGNSLMSLDIVPAALILAHQFLSGRLIIRYDRLLWFLFAWIPITGSLLLNFQSTMLPSFSELTAVYSLFLLSRSSLPEAYRAT